MKFNFLLLLLVISSSLFAQEKINFDNLSKGEKHWALWHPFAAKKAKKIIPLVRAEVRKKIEEGKIDSLIHGGQADAYRHALWMALTAKKIGVKKARRIGQLHEQRNKEAFYKSEVEDGSLQDSISCLMDLQNNDLGIAYGDSYKQLPDDEIAAMVLTGVLNGEFFMLFRNKKNEFMDCEGNVVSNHDRLKNKTWYLPYCLVSTSNTSEIPTR